MKVRRLYWRHYICYTCGLVVMGFHLMLKISIGYMDLESDGGNSMYPRDMDLESDGVNSMYPRIMEEPMEDLHRNSWIRTLMAPVTSESYPSNARAGGPGARRVMDSQRDKSHQSQSHYMADGIPSGPLSNNGGGRGVPPRVADADDGGGGGDGGVSNSTSISAKIKATFGVDGSRVFEDEEGINVMQGGGFKGQSPAIVAAPEAPAPGKLPENLPVVSDNIWLEQYLSTEHKTEQDHRGFLFTCSNIDQILLKRKLGQGVTKQVYLGQYGGRKIAVKMVTRNVIDVKSCLDRLKRNVTGVHWLDLSKETQRCYTLPNMKLMKEILLLQQIQHPNLLKLLGYCVRSEETESTSLQDHGVLAVYEYALPFYPSTLESWPWFLRVKTAFELADLLHYLHSSPLGSLRISDFKDIHFLLKDGRIKLTDLDDVTSLEPKCDNAYQGKVLNNKSSIVNNNQEMLNMPDAIHNTFHSMKTNSYYNRQPATCGYNLECIAGICIGFNALHNLAHMNKHYFRHLVYENCEDKEDMCARLRIRLENLDINAEQLKEYLYSMMRVSYVPGYN